MDPVLSLSKPMLHAVHQIGRMRLVQLYDGAVEHSPAQHFFGTNVDASTFAAYSAKHGIDPHSFSFPATVSLVEVGADRILIDTGHGFAQNPGAGLLPQAMAQAGIDPASITHVVLTHLHRDHTGGVLNKAGALVFPNARHWVSPLELAYWTGPEAHTPIGQAAVRLADRLGDRLSAIVPGDEPVEGVQIVESAGHTPGHICVLLESDGKRALIIGDVANHPVWAIMQPQWHMNLDVNPDQAVATRLRLLGHLADTGTLMGGFHMAFPALGHIERQPFGDEADDDAEDRFVYVPLES